MEKDTKGGSDQRKLSLTGPEALSLQVMHPLGPLAARSSRIIHLPCIRFTLKHTGDKPLKSAVFDVEPLRREEDGASVQAICTVNPEDDKFVAGSIEPGEVLQVRLTGEGYLPPGSYRSNLRITVKDIEDTLLIPITVSVQAHWAWAMGFMFLGLMFLGLSVFLAAAESRRTQLAEALYLRQTVHEFLEHHPPAEADYSVVASIDDALVMALEALSAPMPLGIKDWRLVRAEHYQAQAHEQFEDLRRHLKEKAPGSAEVEKLQATWQDLNARVAAAREVLPPPEDKAEAEFNKSLTALVQAFQRAQWHIHLDPLFRAIKDRLGPQVERARLALSAGEGARAQELASTVHRWLRRAARNLEQRVCLLLGWRSLAVDMVIRQIALVKVLNDPAFPEEARNELSTLMEAAKATLSANLSPENFRDAYKMLQEAETAVVSARSKLDVEHVRASIQAVKEQTSLASIEQAMEDFSPDDSIDTKQQKGLHIMELWRERVEIVEDPNRKKKLLDLITSSEQCLKRGDLEGSSPGFKKLLDQWLAYQNDQQQKALWVIEEAQCRRFASNLRDQLKLSRESLVLLEPHPMVAGLEEELEQLRSKVQKVSLEPGCMDVFLKLQKDLLTAGDRMFTAVVMAVDIPSEARLAAAEHSEVREAIVLARRLMTEPWPVQVTSRTRYDDLYVDRQVVLEVSNLDPAWGPGTQVIVDFGDESEWLIKTAEQIRQEAVLTHRYSRPERVVMHVLMAEDIDERSLRPLGDILGEGEKILNIRPSPISTALAMSDFFLNLRFLLALSIGLLIQGWRFYGQEPFGIRDRDYLEAFALGFGINAGVATVAAIVSNIGF